MCLFYMDDTEFVVIDDNGGHQVKEAVRCLKNSEESYRNAHGTPIYIIFLTLSRRSSEIEYTVARFT